MVNNKKLSVVIVDDEEAFRQGLRTLINLYSTNSLLPIEIVGEADCLEQVIKFTNQKKPDLILLDLELMDSDGITTLLRLKEISYSGKVLVLSAHQEDDWIFRAMQAGAAGYVFKINLGTQLYEAINTVLNSNIYLPPEAASSFFRHFHHTRSDSVAEIHHQLQMTQREQEVLHWLVQGASNEEIAKHLYVTVATVKAHLTSVFEKLQVTSRTQAIITAFKLGLV
jgi:DNA-binding NarL/FixJ family response regulator